MNVEIKGIHVKVSKRIQDYIDAKMPRLDFGRDLIVDFLMNISREKSLFKLETTLNFRWGASKHVGVENFDLNKGIDDLYDKLEAVIEKEKSRIKDHHKKQEPGVAEE
ncbi:MAG: ribosome-associated translation inhibitor RaiA [Spirochaetia bacterium]|jgi:putative sigma-54 modulation protein